MIAAKVYLDEDIQSDALIRALRSRDVDVLTTSEARMVGRSDEEQLQYASGEMRVLVSGNIADFARLHRRWITSGRDHAGIVLLQQRKWGPGELARRVVRLLRQVDVREIVNRLEFLGVDKQTVEILGRPARRGRMGGWQGASEAHPQLRAVTSERRGQPPLLPRARRVAPNLALARSPRRPRWAEIAWISALRSRLGQRQIRQQRGPPQ